MQNGFQDTFTATAMAALEMGMLLYAQGLVDHQWANFVRYDGMINYRAEEVAQSCRMLTILAVYHDYADDDSLLLRHFGKAKAMAEWIVAVRRRQCLRTAAPFSHALSLRLTTLSSHPSPPHYSCLPTTLAAPQRIARVWDGRPQARHPPRH